MVNYLNIVCILTAMADTKSIALLIAALLLAAVVLIILISHYLGPTVEYDEEYRKCTGVCAATLDEGFVTHYLCERQCKKELMERIKG